MSAGVNRVHRIHIITIMSTYISVAEEEAAEPIELPTEDDGTGSDQCDTSVTMSHLVWSHTAILGLI